MLNVTITSLHQEHEKARRKPKPASVMEANLGRKQSLFSQQMSSMGKRKSPCSQSLRKETASGHQPPPLPPGKAQPWTSITTECAPTEQANLSTKGLRCHSEVTVSRIYFLPLYASSSMKKRSMESRRLQFLARLLSCKASEHLDE